MGELLAAGILHEGAKKRGGMGKPPIELCIIPTHTLSMGVNLSNKKAHAIPIDALGSTLEVMTFAPSQISDGLQGLLKKTDATREQLSGIGLTGPHEEQVQEAAARVHDQLHLPVTSITSMAASVHAERYFGQAQQLGRFVYVDAENLEVGGMIGDSLIGQAGSLLKILDVAGDGAPPTVGLLFSVLPGIGALVNAQAIIIQGVKVRDLGELQRVIPNMRVLCASSHASDPALGAATLPLRASNSVP